jgi:FkbM family methyltransferase
MFKQLVKSSLAKLGYQLISKYRYGADYVTDISHVLEDKQLSAHLTFRSNNIVFDVGANTGQSSLKFLQTYPESKIYAFEPIEATFNELKTNVSSFDNVSVYQLGLGDKVEKKEIYIYRDSVLSSCVSNSPWRSAEDSISSVTLDIDTLDRFCLEHKIDYIDLLKVDTEGFDLNVIKGAQGLLERQAMNFIYFEFYRVDRDNDDTSGGRLVDIHNYLINFGYRPVAFYTDYVHHDRTAGVYNALYMKWKQ